MRTLALAAFLTLSAAPDDCIPRGGLPNTFAKIKDGAEVRVGYIGGSITAQPGWRWSECIKPVAGTESCQSHHVGAVVSGGMHVVHNDGTEQDIAEGDAYVIEPGHDAWVTSDQPFVAFEFDSGTAGSYAKPTG